MKNGVFIINLFRGVDVKCVAKDVPVAVVKGDWEYACEIVKEYNNFFKNAVTKWRELEEKYLNNELTDEKEKKEWEQLCDLDIWAIQPGFHCYASTSNYVPLYDGEHLDDNDFYVQTAMYALLNI